MEDSKRSETWKIAAFYKFTVLTDFEELAEKIVNQGLELGIRGTFIVSEEGINSTCSGSPSAIDAILDLIKAHPLLADIEVKYSYADFCPFPKFKVKKKPEIVTFRQKGADPRETVGEYLNPEQWNELLEEPDVVTIDTRNDYEVKVGQFKGAINPITDDFTEFAEFVEKELSDHKDKKIAMYCTGGIRCERSTAYLKKKGFKHVYHLKGGILKYLETMPQSKSLWEGDCFVFDYRVAVDHDLKPALWKIDPETNLPEPMVEAEVEKISDRRRSGAIFKKPYTY
tara:strand:+ start:366 stop:1217 length:852 start_codon:yes stop_codon:yes gene_type:complete